MPAKESVQVVQFKSHCAGRSKALRSRMCKYLHSAPSESQEHLAAFRFLLDVIEGVRTHCELPEASLAMFLGGYRGVRP